MAIGNPTWEELRGGNRSPNGLIGELYDGPNSQNWLDRWWQGNNINQPSVQSVVPQQPSFLQGAKGMFDSFSGGDDNSSVSPGQDYSLDPGTAETSDLIAGAMTSSVLSGVAGLMPGGVGMLASGAVTALDAGLANASQSVLGSYYPGSNTLGGKAMDFFNGVDPSNGNDDYDDGGISMGDSIDAGGTTTGGFRSDGTPYGGYTYDYGTDTWGKTGEAAESKDTGMFADAKDFLGLSNMTPGTWFGGKMTNADKGAFITDPSDSFYDSYRDADGFMDLATQISFGLVPGIDPEEADRYSDGGDLNFGKHGTGWHLTGPGEQPDKHGGLHTSNPPAGGPGSGVGGEGGDDPTGGHGLASLGAGLGEGMGTDGTGDQGDGGAYGGGGSGVTGGWDSGDDGSGYG